MSEKLKKVLAVLPALALWQLAAMLVHSSILLVSPVSVLRRLAVIWLEPPFLEAVIYSVLHITAGFLLGWFLGSLLAAAAYMSSAVRILLWPWMAVVRSVPVASFIVICLVWLSPANLSSFISFLIVLPFVYQNLLEGLNSQDEHLREMADIFCIRGWKRIYYLILPQLHSYIMSALSVTAGLAWKAGIAAEIIGTPGRSIGKNMYLAKQYLDTDDLLAWTVIVVLISVLFEKTVTVILKKILPKA